MTMMIIIIILITTMTIIMVIVMAIIIIVMVIVIIIITTTVIADVILISFNVMSMIQPHNYFFSFLFNLKYTLHSLKIEICSNLTDLSC